MCDVILWRHQQKIKAFRHRHHIFALQRLQQECSSRDELLGFLITQEDERIKNNQKNELECELECEAECKEEERDKCTKDCEEECKRRMIYKEECEVQKNMKNVEQNAEKNETRDVKNAKRMQRRRTQRRRMQSVQLTLSRVQLFCWSVQCVV